MDLTVDLPDSRGNLSFVWFLHEPVDLINTGPQTFVENSVISDLKTKCRPFEQFLKFNAQAGVLNLCNIFLRIH